MAKALKFTVGVNVTGQQGRGHGTHLERPVDFT
jgi:hypothetical protein